LAGIRAFSFLTTAAALKDTKRMQSRPGRRASACPSVIGLDWFSLRLCLIIRAWKPI